MNDIASAIAAIQFVGAVNTEELFPNYGTFWAENKHYPGSAEIYGCL